MIDQSLLVNVLFVEVAFLASLLTLLLGLAARLAWRDAWSLPLLERGRAVIASFLTGAELSPDEFRWFQSLSFQSRVRLFFELTVNLIGEDKRRLTTLAQHIGFIDQAESKCRSWFWWRRLQGARVHTLFDTGEPVMRSLLGDTNSVVRAQAAEWAASHPTVELVNHLLTILAESNHICRFAVQDSLLRMGNVVAERLPAYLSSPRGKGLEAALEIAVGLADPRFLAPAISLCTNPSVRVRSLAVRLIGRIGGDCGIEIVTKLLDDEAAEVRAAATAAMGALGHFPAASRLKIMLGDPAWEVRRAAGLALREFGSPGLLLLRRAAAEQNDLASEMARQVLDIPSGSEIASMP